MKRIILALTAAAAITIPATPALAGQDHEKPEKVTICHRTNADSNPYVLITVAASAVDGEGKNDHTLHVVDENHARADIIPAPVDEESGEPYCPGPTPPKDGEDGQDGRTPIVVCVPGVGLSFTFDAESVVEPAFVLEVGEVCPLAGSDGKDGTNGVNGTNGKDGANGSSGANGLNGLDSDAALVTELNNRLFVLENAAVTDVAQPTTTPPAQPAGELPHTGSNATIILLAIGALLLGFGITSRILARR